MESISRKLTEMVKETLIDDEHHSTKSNSLPDELSSTFTEYSDPISSTSNQNKYISKEKRVRQIMPTVSNIETINGRYRTIKNYLRTLKNL